MDIIALKIKMSIFSTLSEVGTEQNPVLILHNVPYKNQNFLI